MPPVRTKSLPAKGRWYNYHAGEETIVRVLVELSASVDQLTAAIALFLRPLHRSPKDQKVTFLRHQCAPHPAVARASNA